MGAGLCRDLISRKLKPKKMIGDFAIRLNELREYGVAVVEQHPGKRSTTAVFAPLVLLYVIIKAVFF